MMQRHKVFISFQHGCQEENKPCGIKHFKNQFSSSPWPLVDFKECNGYCRNKEMAFQAESKCMNFNICGHYWKERFEYLFSFQVESFISKDMEQKAC
jgi:hypothetical protein